MKRKALLKTIEMETKLYLRGFFGPFFSLLFPLLMLFLFGSLYGNDPSPFFGGRGAMDVTIPAYLGMIIAVGGMMTLPLGLIEYQANRVYNRFDATPLGKLNLILVQLGIYVFFCFVSSAVLVGVGILVYQIHIVGSWLQILPVFFLSVLCLFSMGFLITAVFANTKIAQLVSYLLYFIMLFLSGATMPAELFPENIRALNNMLPLTHVVKGLQSAFSGNPFTDVWGSLVILAGVTLVCGSLGILCYRRRRWD